MAAGLRADIDSVERVADLVAVLADDVQDHRSQVDVDAGHPALTAALRGFGARWTRSAAGVRRTNAELAEGLASAARAYRAVDAQLARLAADATTGLP
jgi:hypothetical protein